MITAASTNPLFLSGIFEYETDGNYDDLGAKRHEEKRVISHVRNGAGAKEEDESDYAQHGRSFQTDEQKNATDNPKHGADQ
jgi:hypothetical protein